MNANVGKQLTLTVGGADGRSTPIAPASVDRIRHTVTNNRQSGSAYELRIWSQGRRVTLDGPRDAVRQLAAEVAARHGVGRLEIGMDWGTSIFYLVVALGGLMVIGGVIVSMFFGVFDLVACLAMLPVLGILGFAIFRTMDGRCPPHPAGSLEKFLAVLGKH